VKYYVYASRTKIEMLFSQLATPTTRQASIGFDLKVVKGELRESREVAGNLYSQLEAILGHLHAADLVGPPASGKPYISGAALLTWAPFVAWGEPTPVTFWACNDADLMLGLAGSKRHIIGHKESGETDSASLTNAIVSYFLREFGELDHEWSQKSSGELPPKAVIDATLYAVERCKGTVGRYEFVAKVLARGAGHHRESYRGTQRPEAMPAIVLATPLFVAQLD